VFFRLRELRAGDPVVITRSDGKDVTFQVNAVEQYPKGAFPSNAVYGPAPGSSLRLITCGGTFDAAARSYRDNIVVYASEVAVAPTPPAAAPGMASRINHGGRRCTPHPMASRGRATVDGCAAAAMSAF